MSAPNPALRAVWRRRDEVKRTERHAKAWTELGFTRCETEGCWRFDDRDHVLHAHPEDKAGGRVVWMVLLDTGSVDDEPTGFLTEDEARDACRWLLDDAMEAEERDEAGVPFVCRCPKPVRPVRVLNSFECAQCHRLVARDGDAK